jgi:hypothetical protein
VPETREDFGNPEKGLCPSLETVTRRLVKTQQAENTQACVPMKSKVRRTVRA